MRYSDFRKLYVYFRTFSKIVIPTFAKIILSKSVPGVFLFLFLVSLCLQRYKIKWCWGLVTGSKIQKSWNLEFRAFKIMKAWFYDTNLEQINSRSRKLLKVLFKPISPINGPKIAIIIPIYFPMIFLWFLYDFSISSCVSISSCAQNSLDWTP